MSDEQKDAIAKMKSFTDFNDLATKSSFGMEGVNRQLKAAIDGFVKHLENEKVREQENNEYLKELPKAKNTHRGL